MSDQQLYDEGLRPRVLINWESFERRGIPPAWRGPFTGAVINAYTRWATVAGVDLRFQFFGYTNKTYASAGELLIHMDDRHPTAAAADIHLRVVQPVGSRVSSNERRGPVTLARARHLYPDFTRNRLRQVRSTDGGVTWSPAGNDLTSYNHIHARTNISISRDEGETWSPPRDARSQLQGTFWSERRGGSQ